MTVKKYNTRKRTHRRKHNSRKMKGGAKSPMDIEKYLEGLEGVSYGHSKIILKLVLSPSEGDRQLDEKERIKLEFYDAGGESSIPFESDQMSKKPVFKEMLKGNLAKNPDLQKLFTAPDLTPTLGRDTLQGLLDRFFTGAVEVFSKENNLVIVGDEIPEEDGNRLSFKIDRKDDVYYFKKEKKEDTTILRYALHFTTEPQIIFPSKFVKEVTKAQLQESSPVEGETRILGTIEREGDIKKEYKFFTLGRAPLTTEGENVKVTDRFNLYNAKGGDPRYTIENTYTNVYLGKGKGFGNSNLVKANLQDYSGVFTREDLNKLSELIKAIPPAQSGGARKTKKSKRKRSKNSKKLKKKSSKRR